MDILKDEALFHNFEQPYPLQEFPKAIRGCVALTEGDATANPNKTGLIALRVFVEQSFRAQTDQKFVVGIRFYGFGDMATIDVVSLDRENHREIAYEHAARMGWLLTEDKRDQFAATYGVPLMYSGGHLKTPTEGVVEFFGSSGDYGHPLLGSDAVSLASFAISVCGLTKAKAEAEPFFTELLSFLQEHKLKSRFYENLVDMLFKKGVQPTGQHLGALVSMKANDRATKEQKSLIQVLTEEITGGLAGHCLVSGVAHQKP